MALKALITRQGAYASEAERERSKMGDQIMRLEREKDDLDTENKRNIDENRYLTDQLEELNNQIVASDAHIASLDATLASTCRDMDKLNSLAAQASLLETQISIMEADQARLLQELSFRGEETQAVTQRWKLAERTASGFSDQIDKIENEAREERQRHAQVIARLERRLSVQRELEEPSHKQWPTGSAPDRINNSNQSIVSNFVKEILQDNANLQMGICELRELLSSSNEEVENLRARMMDPSASREKPSVSNIEPEPSKDIAIDSPLHVHHHYHAAPSANSRREKRPGMGRGSKRRTSSSGIQSPYMGFGTPRSLSKPRHFGLLAPSSASTILSQTSVSVPPHERPSQRRSPSLRSLRTLFSNEQASGAASPISSQDEQPMFEFADDVAGSTRPTSPASTDLGSPDITSRHYKRESDISIRSLAVAPPTGSSKPEIYQTDIERLDAPVHGNIVLASFDSSVIPEEPDEDSTIPADDVDSPSAHDHPVSMVTFRPRLQRASSAESIFSNRGVNIPQLHSRASQLLNTGKASMSPSMASAEQTSSISATGRTSKVSRHQDPSLYAKQLLAGGSKMNKSASQTGERGSATLGKRLGGWVTGRWGVAPASGTTSTKGRLETDQVRPTRKKQTGLSATHIPTKVETDLVDSALLEDALG